MPTLQSLSIRFGLSILLGFLIGLEREREKELTFAGMRTFALISLLGALLAFASEQFAGEWLFVIGFAGVAGFGLLSYWQTYSAGSTGITTEVVFLIAYVLGSLAYWEMFTLAAAITVIVVLLLTVKPNLQSLLEKIDREDIIAGLEFAVVWLVVLPLLPNQTFGPLDVLNPREIWIFVVLIAGLNLFNYILSQAVADRKRISVSGVIGGFVSSTALTLDFSRRSADEPDYRLMYALAIAIASAGTYLRVLVLCFVIDPAFGAAMLPPMLTGLFVVGAGAFLLWRRTQQNGEQEPTSEPAKSPFALGPALRFGLLFAVVLWVSKAAEIFLGGTGTYISSAVGGLVGMDAVTLAIAKLSGGSLAQTIAVRSVTLGAAANALFKGGVVLTLGKGQTRRWVVPLMVIAAAATVAVAFLG